MAIRITSKKDGFYRCGIPHSKKPTVYPDGRFSKKELEILRAEPMLVVEAVKEKEDKKPTGKGKDKDPVNNGGTNEGINEE